MKISNYQALTFDCYGTIIDWEAGILQAIQPILAKQNLNIDDESILQAFAVAESHQQSQHPDMLYPDILANVLVAIASKLNFKYTEADKVRFSQSVADWPAFPDSAQALQYLQQYYRLIVLSNIDMASFAQSEAKLGLTFDAVLTAQEIGSYKPDQRNFQYLIKYCDSIGIEKQNLLHVAQSLYHDHIPAKANGLTTCWVNRRADKPGFGATKIPETVVTPDMTVKSLAELVRCHQQELAQR